MSTTHSYDPFLIFDQFLGNTVHPRLRVAPYEEPQGSRMLKPRMDLHEDTDNNLVTATFELPGTSKDKVNIEVHNGNLTISGEVSESTEKNEHEYSVRERTTGRFTRSVKLPEGTKPQDVKAGMDNGVLTVTFPKRSAGQEPQRITID